MRKNLGTFFVALFAVAGLVIVCNAGPGAPGYTPPPASGGSSAFSAITAGTNTTAAMVVGTGASISATGSGSITATALSGGTPAYVGSANTFTTGPQTVQTGGDAIKGVLVKANSGTQSAAMVQLLDSANNPIGTWNPYAGITFQVLTKDSTLMFESDNSGNLIVNGQYQFTTNFDTGLVRQGAGLVAATNSGSGSGDFYDRPSVLTAGTMTATNTALLRTVTNRFDWTNAMVVALGASTTGDITVCTLPANTVVKSVWMVLDTPDTSANALTVAVGRTSASFIDYVTASDAKATAGTTYGVTSGTRGTNNTMYDVPSVSGTTAVKAHFIKTTTNLSTVLGCTGHIYIESYIAP